jgi:hypothetical protein
LASVIFRASPPSARMAYSWFWPDALVGASRFDMKTKNDPSRAQAGDASFLSFVKVSCFVEATPRSSATR